MTLDLTGPAAQGTRVPSSTPAVHADGVPHPPPAVQPGQNGPSAAPADPAPTGAMPAAQAGDDNMVVDPPTAEVGAPASSEAIPSVDTPVIVEQLPAGEPAATPAPAAPLPPPTPLVQGVSLHSVPPGRYLLHNGQIITKALQPYAAIAASAPGTPTTAPQTPGAGNVGATPTTIVASTGSNSWATWLAPPAESHSVLSANQNEGTWSTAYIPKPLNGWPVTVFVDPLGPCYGQDPVQFKYWEDEIAGGVFIHIFARSAIDRQEESLTMISTFLEREGIQGALVSPANAHSTKIPIPRHEHPPVFLVHNISPAQAQFLIEAQVFAHRAGTFLVYPRERRSPTFLGYFHGFPAAGAQVETNPDVTALTVDIRTSLANSSLCPLLEKISAGSLPDVLPGDRVTYYLATLRITPIKMTTPQNQPIRCWRLYIESPAQSLWEWNQITAWFRDHALSTFLNGSASAMHTFSCGGCHSDDHPHGLCPFFDVPLWNGPNVHQRPLSRDDDPVATAEFLLAPRNGQGANRGSYHGRFPTRGHN